MWNDLKQEVKMLRQYSTPLGNIWYVIQVSTNIITNMLPPQAVKTHLELFKLFSSSFIISTYVSCPLIKISSELETCLIESVNYLQDPLSKTSHFPSNSDCILAPYLCFSGSSAFFSGITFPASNSSMYQNHLDCTANETTEF